MTQAQFIKQQQTQVAAHGALILLLGLLSGIGLAYAATTGSVESDLYKNWKFAHMEGITNGLVALAIAGVYANIYRQGLAHSIAKWVLILGCYCNIIGPFLTALFIGHRVIVPETALEAFITYGFYTPGTLPMFSFMLFVYNGFRHSRSLILNTEKS